MLVPMAAAIRCNSSVSVSLSTVLNKRPGLVMRGRVLMRLTQRWRHSTSGTLHIEDLADVDLFLCTRFISSNYEKDDEPPAPPMCMTCFRRAGFTG